MDALMKLRNKKDVTALESCVVYVMNHDDYGTAEEAAAELARLEAAAEKMAGTLEKIIRQFDTGNLFVIGDAEELINRAALEAYNKAKG